MYCYNLLFWLKRVLSRSRNTLFENQVGNYFFFFRLYNFPWKIILFHKIPLLNELIKQSR